jgi:hypothetical protein
MSKASIPTYRKMKISETNDNVAKACLHRLLIRIEKYLLQMIYGEKNYHAREERKVGFNVQENIYKVNIPSCDS